MTDFIDALKKATRCNFDTEATGITPLRFLKALEEITEGATDNPENHIKTFESNNNEMITVANIEYFSLCEHHLLPFFGKATVGYIPNGQVIGLSKIPRIVSCFARRVQIQERLTDEIADFLQKALKPKGVGVHLTGQHLCMMARGAKQVDAIMHTTALRGCFQKGDVKKEFLDYRRNHG